MMLMMLTATMPMMLLMLMMLTARIWQRCPHKGLQLAEASFRDLTLTMWGRNETANFLPSYAPLLEALVLSSQAL